MEILFQERHEIKLLPIHFLNFIFFDCFKAVPSSERITRSKAKDQMEQTKVELTVSR